MRFEFATATLLQYDVAVFRVVVSPVFSEFSLLTFVRIGKPRARPERSRKESWWH